MQSIISETNNLWGASSFSKYSKFYIDFRNAGKDEKILFDFQITAFELVPLHTRFYWKKILVIGCQYLNKQSQDFRYYWMRIFWADFLSEWSNNKTKILPCRFRQCFGFFNMLTLHRCSDMGLLRHLSNPPLRSL